MNTLVELLFQKNKEKFRTKEEIQRIFIDAQINGNLFAIAEILTNTYGPDALKTIDRIPV
jgi:hypothetical protein